MKVIWVCVKSSVSLCKSDMSLYDNNLRIQLKNYMGLYNKLRDSTQKRCESMQKLHESIYKLYESI